MATKTKSTRIARLCKGQRTKLGISQSKLAKAMGYGNSQMISNLERGVCSLPLAQAKKFCTKLSLAPAQVKSVLIADYVDKISQAVG